MQNPRGFRVVQRPDGYFVVVQPTLQIGLPQAFKTRKQASAALDALAQGKPIPGRGDFRYEGQSYVLLEEFIPPRMSLMPMPLREYMVEYMPEGQGLLGQIFAHPRFEPIGARLVYGLQQAEETLLRVRVGMRRHYEALGKQGLLHLLGHLDWEEISAWLKDYRRIPDALEGPEVRRACLHVPALRKAAPAVVQHYLDAVQINENVPWMKDADLHRLAALTMLHDYLRVLLKAQGMPFGHMLEEVELGELEAFSLLHTRALKQNPHAAMRPSLEVLCDYVEHATDLLHACLKVRRALEDVDKDQEYMKAQRKALRSARQRQLATCES